MAAPIDAFVAGQYYTFYSQPNIDGFNYPRYVSATSTTILDTGLGTVPSWVGATRTGFNLITTSSAEIVEGDVLGGSAIDMIYRGGNVFMDWDAISFRPGAVLPSWPWQILGNIGTIGRLGSAVAGTLYMAAAPFTPAGGSPLLGQLVINALTARNAILAENIQTNLLFDSRLRRIPIRMRLLPFLASTFTVNISGSFATKTANPLNTPINTSIVFGSGPFGPITTTSNTATAAPLSPFGPGPDPAASSANLTTSWAAWNAATLGDSVSGVEAGIRTFTTFPNYAWYILI